MQSTILWPMGPREVIARLNNILNWLSVVSDGKNGVNVAAAILTKTRRTVEAYRAISDKRAISPSDMLKLYDHIIRCSAAVRSNPVVPITVFDADYNPIVEVHSLGAASLIADRVGGSFFANDRRDLQMLNDMANRSRLRKILHTGLVTTAEACEAFGVDEYTLIFMQLEHPIEYYATTPTNSDLRILERKVSDRMHADEMEFAF